MSSHNNLQYLKSFAPKCKRMTDNEERDKSSQSWNTYHTDLDDHFSQLDFQTFEREKIELRLPNDFFFLWCPSVRNADENRDFKIAEEALLQLANRSIPAYPTNNRRHSANQPLSLHMGFYEQNLQKSSQRTWKLYAATDRLILLKLKPILKRLSVAYIKTLKDPDDLPCPPEFGIFGTIFTTVVVNFGTCHWHVDPKDKMAYLIYFGDFQDGALQLGPPIQKFVPVQRFDTILFKSSSVFHRALPFTGTRINVSCYSKKTTKKTKKGLLIIDKSCKWATKP